MIDRRTFGSAVLATAGLALTPSFAWATAELEVSEDGLHVQPWFMQTFLDLRDDHTDLSANNKRLAILFEQRGCPYCREMHRVNFKDDRLVDYIKENFGVQQLNIWGSRKVVDFDGEELEERDLARKWGVVFTPTTVFISKDAPEGKSGKELEVARMPGYFKPFHHISMFEYVKKEAYKDQVFQRFLQDRFKELEAKGIKPDVW
jgi:thioredoxin-related protein